MSIQYNKIQVQVSLENLRHNYRVFRSTCDNVIPVIKSDAYGHGLIEVGQAMEQEGAETLAVGFVNEAVLLRESGCEKRIFALLGPVDDADFAALWDHDILAAMGRFDQLERVAQMAEERGEVRVGLKFDTGMRRLGFRPEDVPEVIEFFRSNPKVVPVMATSHLALADEPENVAAVNGQAEKFQTAVDALRGAGFEIEANLSNSAGSIAHERCHYDSLRLGIALYGCNPLHDTEWAGRCGELRPAMEVSAPVMHVHCLKKGESVSYGWTYTADHDLTVAVVGVGYADNYSRSLSNTGYMNIKGHRAPILGRICMQMTMVDVTGIMGEGLDVRPGDRAWLLGGPGPGTITPEDLAGWWETITYEVFCLLGMNRRQYK